MSDWPPPGPPPQQTVLRVHHGVLIDAPIVPPWGSRPWAATVWRDDRAPAGWGRALMAPGPTGRGYVTDGLTPGDVVEFGADHRTQAGRKTFEMIACRWYGVVLVTDPRYVVALGPFPGPEPARQWAERAMHAWRQSVLVDIPGVTDRSWPAPALPAPRDATAATPAVEVRSDPRITRVDDPTHGTLFAATDLFGAAMATDTAELLALLDDTRARTGQPELTGREPKTTLAALMVIHDPGSLEVVDAVETVTEAPPTIAGVADDAVFYGHPDGTVEMAQRDRERRVVQPSGQWTPDGFAWGYHGEGPTELAYSLLAAGTGRRDVARRLAPRYAAEVIAQLPQGQAWSLPARGVADWAAAVDQQPPIVVASRSAPRRARDQEAGL